MPPRHTGALTQALEQRNTVFAAPDRDESAPLVSIPLFAEATAFGVIAIYRLLDHKPRLEAEDRELIGLLAERASIALHFARVYSESERRRAMLHGCFELLKTFM